MNQIKNFSYKYNILNNQEVENSIYLNNGFECELKEEKNINEEVKSIVDSISNQTDNDMKKLTRNDVKKTDSSEVHLRKNAVLSWDSVTIRADTRSSTDKFLNLIKCSNSKKKFTTILNNVKGIVKPFEMLALMGPR